MRPADDHDGAKHRRRQHGHRIRALLALALTTLVACSSGGDDDEIAPATTPPSALEKLTVVTYPGFTSSSPPGSECETASHPSTQSVDASSRELTWDYCGLNADFTHASLQRGNRPLSDAEFQSVADALHRVAVTHGNSCGEDAAVVTLDVQNEDGIDRYANDFYAGCPQELQHGRAFASGLEALAQVTQTLASSGKNSGQ